jgi:hypothetical protein
MLDRAQPSDECLGRAAGKQVEDAPNHALSSAHELRFGNNGTLMGHW